MGSDRMPATPLSRAPTKPACPSGGTVTRRARIATSCPAAGRDTLATLSVTAADTSDVPIAQAGKSAKLQSIMLHIKG